MCVFVWYRDMCVQSYRNPLAANSSVHYALSYVPVQGTVKNRALPSLPGGSLQNVYSLFKFTGSGYISSKAGSSNSSQENTMIFHLKNKQKMVFKKSQNNQGDSKICNNSNLK